MAHGAYHFVYWCRAPMEEMAFFEQIAPVEDDALPPVLDVEATPTSPTCHRHLTEESAIADMKVMLEEMERHYGKRPIIYTTVDFYQAILSDGAFMDYPIWVRSTKYHPAVKYGLRPWRFWQYQSDGFGRGHCFPCRSRRLFWHREAVGGLPRRSGISRATSGRATVGCAGARRGTNCRGANRRAGPRRAATGVAEPAEQQADAQQADDQSPMRRSITERLSSRRKRAASRAQKRCGAFLGRRRPGAISEPSALHSRPIGRSSQT